jgi:hypothetical protein
MSNRFNRKIDINEKTMSMLEDLPVEVTEWYYNLAASMKSARTCQEYVRSIKRFFEFSNVELENLSETIITKYMISIQTKRNKMEKRFRLLIRISRRYGLFSIRL